MECRWNYSKFMRANKINPNIFAEAKIDRCTQTRANRQRRGPLLEAVRASGRPAFWGVATRRGFVQLRNEGAQSPRSAKKKGFHTFPRRERGLGMDAGGFFLGGGGATRLSDSLESA